jgi:hypothetical protein
MYTRYLMTRQAHAGADPPTFSACAPQTSPSSGVALAVAGAPLLALVFAALVALNTVLLVAAGDADA